MVRKFSITGIWIGYVFLPSINIQSLIQSENAARICKIGQRNADHCNGLRIKKALLIGVLGLLGAGIEPIKGDRDRRGWPTPLEQTLDFDK